MRSMLLALAISVLFSAGCALTPAPALPPTGLWQDEVFKYDPTLVTVGTRELFALDATLDAELREFAREHPAPPQRLEHLLTLIFGPDRRAFAYAGGHSTPAAETWYRMRGDCLSLTIMTVALARALDVPTQMQQVSVPPTFDRRGGVDFLNTHVNVLVHDDRHRRKQGRALPAADLVIDFEPQIGSRQRGTPLDHRAVLARYLNNIAAEELAQGHQRSAYAHFRAAIQADPGYAASYSNMAQMYIQSGLAAGAEVLLRHALSLNGQSDLALGGLHHLLLSQGRDAEALAYQQQLHARREQDPYYWLGMGIGHLQQSQVEQAVIALERAQALATGFDEIHQLLAIAYWRADKPHLARDQLAILSALGTDNASVATLSKKFARLDASPR